MKINKLVEIRNHRNRQSLLADVFPERYYFTFQYIFHRRPHLRVPPDEIEVKWTRTLQ